MSNTYHSTTESVYSIPVEDYRYPSALINGGLERVTRTLEVYVDHESDSVKGVSFKWGDELNPWYRYRTHLKTIVLHAINMLVTELRDEYCDDDFELEVFLPAQRNGVIEYGQDAHDWLSYMGFQYVAFEDGSRLYTRG